MIIYPAIDIKDGQCVRLYQGNFDQQTVYDNTPLTMAKNYKQFGASYVHVVDLDGAKNGQAAQSAQIFEIAKQSDLMVQTGGGIRDQETIEKYLKNGVHRVVLGSIAVKDPALVKGFLTTFGGEQILLAIDININQEGTPMAAVHGWQQESDTSLWQLIDTYQKSGLKHILCTDISKDGTLQGPNFALYQECLTRYPDLSIQASGGVSSLQDIQTLKKLKVAGVIVGKALYENCFSLEEALAC